jgi:hypothetical protein
MSSYRYVLFPCGKQPAPDELRDLQSFAAALAGRFAWGKARDDGRLALAFDRETLEHAASIDPGLDKLLGRWQSHGCELLDHLGFVKDPAALRTTKIAECPPNRALKPPSTPTTPDHHAPPHALLTGKEFAAKESLGRARLSVEQSLQRFAAVERAAAALPYALMAAAAIATLAVGFHLRARLLDADREARKETIERLATESVQEIEPQR